MSLLEHFELLDLLREGPVRTFRARERSTGRAVEAHLFTPSAELLSGLDRLRESQRSAVIDRGSHEGGVYVVTTPLGSAFLDWLGAPATLDSAGAWRIKPQGTSMAEPGAQQPPPTATQAPAPGDFTRMFQLRQAPEPVAVPTPKSAPKSSPSPARQPGQFTRAFQKPAAPAPIAAAPATQAGQPGDFTRMFQTAAPPSQPRAMIEQTSVEPEIAEAVPAGDPGENVPVESGSLSQPREAGSDFPRRVNKRFIVVAIIAVISVILVFVLVRTLY